MFILQENIFTRTLTYVKCFGFQYAKSFTKGVKKIYLKIANFLVTAQRVVVILFALSGHSSVNICFDA